MVSRKKRPIRLAEGYIKSIKEPGVYSDGAGAYGLRLRVRKSRQGMLVKVFSQRVTVDGKSVEVSIGQHPLVKLQEARDRAFDNGELALDNIDPRYVSKLRVNTSSGFRPMAERMVEDWDRRRKESQGRVLFTNRSERLIEENLYAVRSLLSTEGDVARGILVEGSHNRVELLQPIDPESVLMKMRKQIRLRKAELAVFSLGAEWANRIDVTERREFISGEGSFEGFSRDFIETDTPYAVFRFHVSPLTLVYYLETYTKHQALMQKSLKLDLNLVFVADRKGTIPPGSRLLMRGSWGGSKLHVLGVDGKPDRLQPLRLYWESEVALRYGETHSVWTLEGDYGGALLLKFESRYTPDWRML